MNAQGLKQIEDLYHEALALTAEARKSWLAEACGDDEELYREVESLLAEHDGAGGMLRKGMAEVVPEFMTTSRSQLLEPGMRLGQYEILGVAGVGGMGQVYRAKDTRLNRSIAIKVISPDVIQRHKGRERFEREARAISQLNHPNICTLHDVGQQDGIDYLVLEYIEGETLASRLSRAALTLDEALKCATAIAHALDTAHTLGITHRDLKPDNVMLTKAGPKLLDFGLAHVEASEAAERTTNVTQSGTIVGTLPYMAPEQVQGKKTDARTDIFAFGTLLYEMITRRRAFAGESQSTLIAAILEKEPPKLDTIPLPLDRVLRKCLAKDPEDRWQSMRDIAAQLDWIRAGAADRGESTRRSDSRWIKVAMALTLILVAVVIGLTLLQPPDEPNGLAQRIELTIPLPEGVRAIQGLSVSPDGSRISFVGAERIWVYEIATRATRAVQPIATASGYQTFPFWSPDGKFIAYFQPGKLKKVPADGGISLDICDVPVGRGGSWAGDTIIFAKPKDGIYRVSASGGTPALITKPDQIESSYLWPRFLPDGRHFTYYTFGTERVYVASLDVNEPRWAMTALDSETYFTLGFILTAGDGTLRAQGLDPDSLQTTGEPVPLVSGVVTPSGDISGHKAFAASGNVLVYSAANPRRAQFFKADRFGRQLSAVGDPVFAAAWSLSDDGTRVAFRQVDPKSASRRIWQLDLRRGGTVPLTSDIANDYNPLWSPTGDQIVFMRESHRPEGNLQDLHIKRIGSDVEKRIGEENVQLEIAVDWHPNGRTLLLSKQMLPKLQRNFYTLNMMDDHAMPEIWFHSDAQHGAGQFSPTGQWVAFVSLESGAPNVFVRRFPEGDRKEQISMAPATLPRWRSDGKALFYNELSSRNLMEVELDIGSSIKPGTARQLFNLGESNGYAVLPNNEGFLLLRPVDPAPPLIITVVVNWARDLVKR